MNHVRSSMKRGGGGGGGVSRQSRNTSEEQKREQEWHTRHFAGRGGGGWEVEGWGWEIGKERQMGGVGWGKRGTERGACLASCLHE